MRSRNRVQLIGGQILNPADGDYSLIASIFNRLPKEAKYTDNLTRFVGYDGFTQERDHLRFFGIEVNEIEDIPEGMVAWDLSETKWTVWQVKNGLESIIWQEDITWHWLDWLTSNSGRLVGEFAASGL